MEIKIRLVAGIPIAIEWMRLAMKSGDKSDSGIELCSNDCEGEKPCPWKEPKRAVPSVRACIDLYRCYQIGPNDHALAMRLVKSGSDHRKYIRHMIVWVEINAPLYFWSEFDTYRMGVDKSSESTMHTLLKEEIEAEDFELTEWYSENGWLPDPVANYIKFLEENRESAGIQKMKELLPCSYKQKRGITISYEALYNMYHARKNHRLKEWREFCEFIENNLPYSEFITGEEA